MSTTWLHILLEPEPRQPYWTQDGLNVVQRAAAALLNAQFAAYSQLRQDDPHLPGVGEEQPDQFPTIEHQFLGALLDYVDGSKRSADRFHRVSKVADSLDLQICAALLGSVTHREYGRLDHAEEIVTTAISSLSLAGTPDAEPSNNWVESRGAALLDLQLAAISLERRSWEESYQHSQRILDRIRDESDWLSQLVSATAARNLRQLERRIEEQAPSPAPSVGSRSGLGRIPPDEDLVRGLTGAHERAFDVALSGGGGSQPGQYEANRRFWAGLLRQECLGDQTAARNLRAVLGRQELIQSVADIENPPESDDFLLLVRGGAHHEVGKAASFFLKRGPVDALAEALQLATSRDWQAVAFEHPILRLLEAAGDLLESPAAARNAGDLMELVRHSRGVRRRGFDRPYHALRALARVMSAAPPETHRMIGEEMLRLAAGTEIGDRTFRSLHFVLRALDWGELSTSDRRSWRDFIESHLLGDRSEVAASALFGLRNEDPEWAAEVALAAYRRSFTSLQAALVLDVVPEIPLDVAAQIRDRSVEALEEVESNAERGEYEFGGGPSDGLVLVAILLRKRDLEGWGNLLRFLAHERVSITDKTAAIEYIVRHSNELPESVRPQLDRDLGDDLPAEVFGPFFGDVNLKRVGPWLRLAYAVGLGSASMRDQKLFSLMGQTHAHRIEAAATLPYAVTNDPRLTPLAFALSYDTHHDVRGASAAAMVRLAEEGASPASREMATERLRALLGEPGLATPLAVCQSLTWDQAGDEVKSSLTDDLSRVTTSHASAYARRTASNVLQDAG